MFERKNKIYNEIIKTEYGSICIKNIIFDPSKIEAELPLLLFRDDNLKYMFAENKLNNFKKRNILKRFIPKERIKNALSDYINIQMSNVNFYSFLAEGILTLAFRDIYNYNLACGVIDVTDTLKDTHTGVDSCMYSVENQIIILGEAKFYSDVNKGINSIISDFKTKNIRNKLESLQAKAENNEESYNIIIKNLENNNYDGFSLAEFLKQKIIFAGFVLHSEKNSKPDYDTKFYDKFDISIENLAQNIEKCINCSVSKENYEIVLIHLPINDKKDLIEKVINKAKSELLEVK